MYTYIISVATTYCMFNKIHYIFQKGFLYFSISKLFCVIYVILVLLCALLDSSATPTALGIIVRGDMNICEVAS